MYCVRVSTVGCAQQSACDERTCLNPFMFDDYSTVTSHSSAHVYLFKAVCVCSLYLVLGSPGTHPVEEVGAAHRSNLADVVHETQVSLRGAVHLAHLNVSKATLELSPHVLPQSVPDSHPYLVNLIPRCLTGVGEGDN